MTLNGWKDVGSFVRSSMLLLSILSLLLIYQNTNNLLGS